MEGIFAWTSIIIPVKHFRGEKELQNVISVLEKDIWKDVLGFVMLSYISSIYWTALVASKSYFPSLSRPLSLCSTSRCQGSRVISDTFPWVLHGLQRFLHRSNWNCWYPTSDNAHKSWSLCWLHLMTNHSLLLFSADKYGTQWPVSDKVSVSWTCILREQVHMGVCCIQVFKYKVCYM